MNILAKFALASVSIATIAGAANSAVIVIGNSRAQSCYQSAEYARATQSNIDECNAALEHDLLSQRERVATLVNVGILHFYRRDYNTALSHFDQAIAIDAEEPEALLNKAITLLRRDEAGGEALPLFTMALEMGTRKPALAYYGRGLAHELNGDLTAAYYDIQRASEADPDWDVPERDLARFIVQPAN